MNDQPASAPKCRYCKRPEAEHSPYCPVGYGAPYWMKFAPASEAEANSKPCKTSSMPSPQPLLSSSSGEQSPSSSDTSSKDAGETNPTEPAAPTGNAGEQEPAMDAICVCGLQYREHSKNASLCPDGLGSQFWPAEQPAPPASEPPSGDFDLNPENQGDPCPKCGGSGFSGYGTGYDDVCDECGGTRYFPKEQPSPKSEPAPEGPEKQLVIKLWKCRGCDEWNVDARTTCADCGYTRAAQPTEQPAERKLVYCPNCPIQISEGTTCPVCGMGGNKPAEPGAVVEEALAIAERYYSCGDAHAGNPSVLAIVIQRAIAAATAKLREECERLRAEYVKPFEELRRNPTMPPRVWLEACNLTTDMLIEVRADRDRLSQEAAELREQVAFLTQNSCNARTWIAVSKERDTLRAQLVQVTAERDAERQKREAAERQIAMDTECIERIRRVGMQAEADLAQARAEVETLERQQEEDSRRISELVERGVELTADLEQARRERDELKFVYDRNHAGMEKAQKLLDAGRWAGFPLIDGVTTELEEARQQLAEAQAARAFERNTLASLGGYALTVRTDRLDETREFALQTVDWCEGLIEKCEEAEKALATPAPSPAPTQEGAEFTEEEVKQSMREMDKYREPWDSPIGREQGIARLRHQRAKEAQG